MGRPELDEALDMYAARAALGWERTGVFMLRGRARLEGANLLAEGRFVFWGDAAGGLCRGDFMGPDGRPVVSMKGDSTGFTVYMPRDGAAWFSPGGLPAGGGSIGVAGVLHLVRTGFPFATGQSDMVFGADSCDGGSRWEFLLGTDILVLTLEGRDLFPGLMRWPGGEVRILGTTPQDEFEAWPGAWSIETSGQKAYLEILSVDTGAEPWPGLWDMAVPGSVQTDTLERLPAIRPAWEQQIR